MPRAYSTAGTSQPIASGSGSWKTIYEYTAPGQGAVITKNPIVSADSTSSSTAKLRVRLTRGGSGGTGTTANPVAKGSNNPSGVALGTGKENFTGEPTGQTAFPEHIAPPYGAFVFPDSNIVLTASEKFSIQVNAGAAVNVDVSLPEIET